MDDAPHICNPSAQGATSYTREATSPQSKPAVPPKPNSRIHIDATTVKSADATVAHGFNFPRRHSVTDTSPSFVQSSRYPSSPNAPHDSPHRFRFPNSTTTAIQTTSEESRSPKSHGPSSPSTGLSHSPSFSGGVSGHPTNKPALPPKPVVTAQTTSQPPLPDASAGKENGKLNSPPPFLRAKPPQPTPPHKVLVDKDVRDPPRPRIAGPPHPRPKSSATYNFSSPIQNLNSANFPSTGFGLNQLGAGPTPSNVAPNNITQIRAKSASLGRNITFPFSSAPTGGGSDSGGGGFFSRKSSTLSKFKFPTLDLQLGSSSKLPPPTLGAVTSPSRPKPDSLKLNPFIIQQKQQEQQKRAQESQVNNNVISFGKSIAFSPDSPLPPPPPPRLRKKLSPVSPTPPSPFHLGNAPLTPNSSSRSCFGEKVESGGGGVSQMEAVHESSEDITAIYAEVNKEKKWADRKLKQNEVTRKLSLDSSLSSPTHEAINDAVLFVGATTDINSIIPNNNNGANQQFKVICCHKDNPFEQSTKSTIMDSEMDNLFLSAKDCDAEVVSSWLMSQVNGVVPPTTAVDSNPSSTVRSLSANNPFRSVTPTYQSTKTGHIYETIGEKFDNTKKNMAPDHPKVATSLEIHETSEEIRTDELSDNRSFLFKLVINPKKGNDAEPNAADPSNLANISDNSVRGEDNSMDARNNNVDGEANICRQDDEEGMATVETVQSPNSTLNGEHVNRKTKLVVNSSLYTFQTMRAAGDPVNNKNVLPDVVHSYLIPTVIQDISLETPSVASASNIDEITSRTDHILLNESFERAPLQSPEPETSQTNDCNTAPSPAVSNSILRRRSWNCDRVYAVGSGRSTPTESSSATSSASNLTGPPRREKSFGTDLDWVDEGDLSNGALADTETSDVQMRSSAEDVNLRKWATVTASPPPSKGFSSRRLVSSIFSSFGKGSSSTSSGRSSSIVSTGGKKGPVVRHSLAGRRTKDKTISHFIVPSETGQQLPQAPNDGSVSRLGRQISDSVISQTLISSPILPNSVSFDSGIPSHHKALSVQFSPEVLEGPHVFIREQCLEEEAVNVQIDKDGDSSPGNLLSSIPVEGECCVDKIDDGSVSSSDSASGCGSVSGTSISGYEDILAEMTPKEKKSFYVAREILTSERTFVDVLNLLTIDFPNALDNTRHYLGSAVISKEDLEMILGGLPYMKIVNQNLVSELEERIAHWKESPKIADILVKTGPFLKSYASYIKDFQKNSMYLDTCCQKYPLFAEALKNFELSERCQKLGLKHYMLKPVQRMPQYRLLLEDYLKSLDEEDSDFGDTVKGIAIVKDVAEHANEAIRLQVNAEKLLHLQNRLSTGTVILKADRQLIREGELQKICRKELQPRFFALMNDCLFCLTYHAAAGSPKDLKLRYELPLAGMRVALSSAEDHHNEFSVISVTRSFNLVAKSPKERDEWMKALTAAISDNIKKRTCTTPDNEIMFQIGKEAPVWIPDSRVTMCQLCTAEFTVTFRRHHCRACGKVVCGNCSSGLAPLQYLKNVASRVCDSCYEYLLDEFDTRPEDESDSSNQRRASIRDRFKKHTPNVSKRATKIKRIVPSRLEVHANSSGSRISGYLTWRERERKSWKRRWFVLIDRVLYIYAASEDIVAIKSIPLLGWQVETDKPDLQQEDEDNQSFFRLTHMGQHPIWFQADSSSTAEKWIAAMSEAVVLS